MNQKTLYLKVDVDTERGTRLGIPPLLNLLDELESKATFLFSLGPDNTGRAIRRIFRPGFFSKVSRTSVVSTYGLRTLLNGILLPGPHIGKRHGGLMRKTKAHGHEVGIHAYDHVRWQDGLARMNQHQVFAEFEKATQMFEKIFGQPAKTAGTAGWQANAYSLAAYDKAELLYGSDVRGQQVFFPKVHDTTYKTLQIPTTLPTLDELIGLPEYPLETLTDYYLSLINQADLNVMTIHAELEGMAYFEWFSEFLHRVKQQGIKIAKLDDLAIEQLKTPEKIPTREMKQGTVSGRSGTLAIIED